MSESDLRWMAAINHWFDGDGSLLVAEIRDPLLILTDDAREFLADLADGKVSRGKGGRPVERHGWVERSIVAEVFAAWENSSKDEACATVAQRRDIHEGAVRGVVDKLRELGITRERWRKWGRPDFKN